MVYALTVVMHKNMC